MLQVEQLPELGTTEQKQVNAVVETLSTLTQQGAEIAEVAHDARNMVTALDLYCDLLQEPGVLATPFTHYSGELRLVAAASRRLVEKLITLEPSRPAESPEIPEQAGTAISDVTVAPTPARRHWKSIPIEPIKNLAEDLLTNRSLLSSLAGPTIALTMEVQGGAVPVRMSSEDLTRILVNLVKNSAEAMSAVGRIHISLRESCGEPGNCPWITLNVEDNGPGLPDKVLEKLFEPRQRGLQAAIAGEWPVRHRGLGLSITRSVVETAGGTIHAANRDPLGACFQIELPVCRC